ncbi:MAG: hypothetical protein QE271_03170 [Bacteriovoracaceae bacterium]|nr:hypothetical protein [Bacteriovoracaceae bacterium]
MGEWTKDLILPNNLGRYYLGVMLIGFIISFGYANNFILLFTLLCFIFFLWSFLEAWILKKKLSLVEFFVEDHHAQEKQKIHLHCGDLTVSWIQEQVFNLDAYPKGKYRILNLKGEYFFVAEKRGATDLSAIRLFFKCGLGLFHTSKKFPLSQLIYTYPAISKSYVIKNDFSDEVDQSILPSLKARESQNGPDADQMMVADLNHPKWSRVDWKRYSHQNKLFERIRSTPLYTKIILDFSRLNSLTETEVSQLAFTLVEAYRAQNCWMIKKFPNQKLEGPFLSDKDKAYCLRLLC